VPSVLSEEKDEKAGGEVGRCPACQNAKPLKVFICERENASTRENSVGMAGKAEAASAGVYVASKIQETPDEAAFVTRHLGKSAVMVI